MTDFRFPIRIICFVFILIGSKEADSQALFEGKYYSGKGDTEYLQLLENAFRMIRPDPEMENLSMLYTPVWNGLVEGPTWNMWWIQNSFGPTYTLLPFLDKSFQTFIANSQDLWFSQMGNGLRNDGNGYVAPPGCLCDCASANRVYYRQGDGKHHIHDWVYGMTAAGIILQSEMLLISRDTGLIRYYVPLLEQSVKFIERRWDPDKKNFLMGTAANLLGPSFTGSGKLLADGTYEMAYLAEISINYIAALTRLIELEKFLCNEKMVDIYERSVAEAKEGLKCFIDEEGYFIRSLDKDGTKHGVYGADKHGYFESTPNHDAMAFRVACDNQSFKIYEKIKSIPELRPNKFIIANYPEYDELYETDGFFAFGTWVNGGAWATCEARMQLGYYRVGAYNDAKESFKRIQDMAFSFKLDNPLKNFGAEPWQPDEPINCVYDCWGVPGGFLRGLFEYIYKADGVVIYPHIPQSISVLHQKVPVYFGNKKIYISATGHGDISSVYLNGKKVDGFKPDWFFLKADTLGNEIHLAFGLGGIEPVNEYYFYKDELDIPVNGEFWNVYNLRDENLSASGGRLAKRLQRVGSYFHLLKDAGLTNSFEFSMAKLILENVQTINERRQLKESKQLTNFWSENRKEVDEFYIKTVENLYNGLFNHLVKDHSEASEMEKKAAAIWFKMVN